jgi:hypothetical protein
MRIGQVTIPAGGQIALATNQDFVNGGYSIYCSLLIIQNNATHNIRVGDNTVSATKGILLFPTGSITEAPLILRGTLLAQWFIFGTAGDVIDFLYETSN